MILEKKHQKRIDQFKKTIAKNKTLTAAEKDALFALCVIESFKENEYRQKTAMTYAEIDPLYLDAYKAVEEPISRISNSVQNQKKTLGIVTIGSSSSMLIMTALILGPVGAITFAPFALMTAGAAMLGGYDLDKAYGREILNIYVQEIKNRTLAELTEIKTPAANHNAAHDNTHILPPSVTATFNDKAPENTPKNDNAPNLPKPTINFGRK
jgi:hypothetical protein